MKVTRIRNTSEEKFIEEYLIANKPVIVTDAMENWDINRFRPEQLKIDFGSQKVQVYNDLFDLQNIVSLEKYIDKNFFRDESEGAAKQYIRWYTKLKEVEFYWSDEVFKELKNSWGHPYFIPSTNLIIPSNNEAEERHINEYHYPYKGLFISGRGSRTRLHKDPFMSNAVLCQFYGEKEIFLYSPDKEKDVMNKGKFVDVKNPDHSNFPSFKSIEPDYEDKLSPGEIILFPSGWFHDVTCLTDSVSITWNFVHESQIDRIVKHLENNPEDDQLEIVKYFLKNEVPENINAKELIDFFQNKFSVNI